MRSLHIACLLVMLLSLAACRSESPDIVITGAHVWTANPELPSASAIAISNDRIVFVGDDAGAMAIAGKSTRVIDGSGKMVVPGFIDSHVHFLTGGFRLSSVQLRDAATQEEFVRRIGEFAAGVEPGTWIVGGDWDHSLWGGALPERSWIDDVTPDNPVWVNRLDGHMALANTAALSAAGIDDDVADVDGGTIERDQTGRITGLLKDNAMWLVGQHEPDPPAAMEDRALDAAMEYVASNGVTSVHDMSGRSTSYEALQRAHSAGRMKTRVYLAHPITMWESVQEMIRDHGNGDDWLKIGAMKGFVDGSLGSHTAAFFEPYDDSPADSGLLVVDMHDMEVMITQADAADLHPVIHAIGDRAISELLNAFSSAMETNGPKDRRFRVEHAQHVAPRDVERFANLDVIASMQPYHAIDDGRWAEKYIGARIATTYAFRSFADAGVRMAFGSDWFVAPPTPLEGIYAAVTRRTLDEANPEGWVPAQKISVEQALQAYTIDAAYAGFDEDIKGSLEVGKLADMVILGDNLLQIPPENIRDVPVEMTIVGGNVVFERVQ